jgi:MscS family membrane protein
MKHLVAVIVLLLPVLAARAQDPAPDSAAQAAAVVASGQVAPPQVPDFLEHLVDQLLAVFDIRSSGNTLTHYGIALLITLLAYVLRRVVTTFFFGFFKRLAARTETTLDDKLFPALEGPVKALIIVLGAVASLKVLKFPAAADLTLGYVYTGAFSLVLFWGFLRAFDTVLDHLHQLAQEKHLGLAPFMPWIKKSLITIVFVFGVLMIAQSFGADVKAFLAGLGIGGLAFALAAQDTIANLFGSVVVAIDQPFRIGETVKIGTSTGTVEDIGLRSTKIRLTDRSLVIIPNRTVANEAIVNLSRFTGRRVEQVFGLTYDTTADQMQAIVAEIRGLIDAEPDVNAADTHVYFRDLSASSLDIWVAYVSQDPDFAAHMALRQRLNLAIMRAVEARGLAFAFPTQTVHTATPAEKKG